MNYEYCSGITHTIRQGDTLYEISRKHNVALALLLRANPYVDVFNLQVGDTICIPTDSQMAPYPLSGSPEESGSQGHGECSALDKDCHVEGKSSQTAVSSPRNGVNRQASPVGDDMGMRSLVPSVSESAGRGNQVPPASDNMGMRSMAPPVSDNTGMRSMAPPVSDNTGMRSMAPPVSDNMGVRSMAPSVSEGRKSGNQPEQNKPARKWEKYVVQPGDTLADVLCDMEEGAEAFLEKNQPSNIYMLPGVAYYICKKK